MKELTGGRGYKHRLKPNAVPSIFPHKECKRPRFTSKIHAEKQEKRQEMLDSVLLGCKHDGESLSFFREELHNSSVSMLSVSVQCSSVMIDLTTQTDVNKSDTVDVCESVRTNLYAPVPAEAI